MSSLNAENETSEHTSVDIPTKKDELRIKNVSELNNSLKAIDRSVPPAQNGDTSSKNKRKLPTWMLTASSSACNVDIITDNSRSSRKRMRPNINNQRDCKASEQNSLDESEEVSSTNTKDKTKSTEANSSLRKAVTNDIDVADNVAPLNSVKTEPIETNDAENATSGAYNANELTEAENNVAASSNVKTEPHEANGVQSTSNTTKNGAVSDEFTEADNTAASTSNGAQKNNDIKPAIKVEKADASSTTRESCKYGIRCYRRNPQHRIEEAHPGDQDYKRPQYPAPPLGTPACPYGNLCYRRNPTHFQLYTHPDDTDFKKNYILRQRRRQQQQQSSDNDNNNSDSDDYDLEDPFINDDSDLDYLPSDDDIEDTEEF